MDEKIISDGEKEYVIDTRSRSWMVTVSADKMTQSEVEEALSEYTYIGQKEKGTQGGEQGYEHYQIYIENPEPIRFSTLKKKLPTAHLEVRKKSRIDCYNYVTKSETSIGQPFGHGDIILTEEKGKRNDILLIREMIDNGDSLEEIESAFPVQFFTMRKAIETAYNDRLRRQMRKRRRTDLKVIYICGRTGTGKTSYVLDKHGDENVYIMSDYPQGYSEKEKFDGYNGEKVVLFDEFRSNIPLSRMLRYLDVYYCELPARYNVKIAEYTTVYITSNWKLGEQYPKVKAEHPQDWAAFSRRITEVYNFDKSKEKPQPLGFEQLALVADDGDLPF